MARRSPHIASHDLHEVEEHTEKDVIPKKDMYEFGRMNIQRIDSHITRSTGQPPAVPLHPVIPCFLGTEHQEGVSCPLVVSKRYHICDTKCIFQWYLKKYHICGTKTSIVVSKDTTYVVHFADASKKGLFSDSPFCFLSASAR